MTQSPIEQLVKAIADVDKKIKEGQPLTRSEGNIAVIGIIVKHEMGMIHKPPYKSKLGSRKGS